MTKPKWLWTIENKTDMFVSASATDTFVNKCKRKWWLQKIRKLRRKAMKQHNFGMVLHEIIERYLLADELGNDPFTGKPVELFPEGWEQPESKFDEVVAPVNSADAILIKALVDKAISEGVILRHPGVIPEKPLDFVPVQTYECGTRVVVTGSVDISAPGIIEDNKTSKATRWLKSSSQLAEDIQMIFYTFMDQIHMQKQYPDRFILAHNQFIKDPKNPSVRKTTKEVTSEYIRNQWFSRIAPAFKEMARIRKTARCVFDVPEPSSTKPCEAYGGCEFAQICQGRMTESEFEQQYLDSLEQEQQTQKPQPKKENTSMSIFDNISKNKGNAKPKTETTEETTETTETTETPEKVEKPVPKRKAGSIFGGMGGKKPSAAPDKPKPETETKDPEPDPAPEVNTKQKAVAPWHNADCGSCKESPILGFNSKGSPCRVCDIKNRKSGDVESTEFTVSISDNGDITWEPTTEAAAELMEALDSDDGATMVDVKAVEEKTEVVEEPVEEVVEEPVEEVVEEPVEEPVESAPAKKPAKTAAKGRKKSEQIMLFINCAPVKGMSTFSGLAIFQEITSEIAVAAGVDSYFMIDAFKRRDAMEENMDTIVEEKLLGKRIAAEMVGLTGDDYNLFIRALMSRVDIVVR